MRIPEPEEETPLAWSAILENTPVAVADGTEVGTIREVLGSDTEDIFHGIVVGEGLLSRDVFVPAARVASITNKRITTDLTAEELRELPPYLPEESYHLGFVGFLGRRLGWTEEGHGPR